MDEAQKHTCHAVVVTHVKFLTGDGVKQMIQKGTFGECTETVVTMEYCHQMAQAFNDVAYQIAARELARTSGNSAVVLAAQPLGQPVNLEAPLVPEQHLEENKLPAAREAAAREAAAREEVAAREEAQPAPLPQLVPQPVNLEAPLVPEQHFEENKFPAARELAARELAARELAARELAARELAAREGQDKRKRNRNAFKDFQPEIKSGTRKRHEPPRLIKEVEGDQVLKKGRINVRLLINGKSESPPNITSCLSLNTFQEGIDEVLKKLSASEAASEAESEAASEVAVNTKADSQKKAPGRGRLPKNGKYIPELDEIRHIHDNTLWNKTLKKFE